MFCNFLANLGNAYLFVGVADVFLKFFPLKAKLLGGHHFSNLRPWPHLALKLVTFSDLESRI